MVPMNKLLIVCLGLLITTGCSTISTLDANQPGAPVVYSGTRLDLYAINGGCCAKDRFGTEAPKYPTLDLPGSALLDTLLLPLSILTVLGVGFQATGGM